MAVQATSATSMTVLATSMASWPPMAFGNLKKTTSNDEVLVAISLFDKERLSEKMMMTAFDPREI